MTPRQVLGRYAMWASPLLGLALLTLSLLFALPLYGSWVCNCCFFLSVGRVGPNVSALTLAPHGRAAGTASALMGSIQSALTTCAGIAAAPSSTTAPSTPSPPSWRRRVARVAVLLVGFDGTLS